MNELEEQTAAQQSFAQDLRARFFSAFGMRGGPRRATGTPGTGSTGV